MRSIQIHAILVFVTGKLITGFTNERSYNNKKSHRITKEPAFSQAIKMRSNAEISVLGFMGVYIKMFVGA